jgi:hypothetical protein
MAALPGEEDAGVEVAPVAVVEVAGDDHEIDLFFEGKANQVFESVAGGGAKQLRRGVLARTQAGERAVEMDVSGANEAHAASGSVCHSLPPRDRAGNQPWRAWLPGLEAGHGRQAGDGGLEFR